MRQLFKTGVLQLICLHYTQLTIDLRLARQIALLYLSTKINLELYACVDRNTTIVCLSTKFNLIDHIILSGCQMFVVTGTSQRRFDIRARVTISSVHCGHCGHVICSGPMH